MDASQIVLPEGPVTSFGSNFHRDERSCAGGRGKTGGRGGHKKRTSVLHDGLGVNHLDRRVRL